MNNARFKSWFGVLRLWSLTASTVPVLVGAALAARDGRFAWPMLALTLAWPRYCYPLVWTSLVLMLEPLNCWLGRRHLLQHLQQGDWRPVVCLGLGAVICGFFWEMWNYYSYPKWIYHTPGAQFLHVFEMPLLGYGGYVPFALELCAIKNFLWPRSPRLRLAEAE